MPIRTVPLLPRTGLAVVALALGALAGCRGHGGGPGGGAGGHAMPPPQVTAVQVEPRSVALPYSYAGRVEGAREVEVRARVSGILLKRAFEEGMPVKKGDALFLIDPAPYRAAVDAAAGQLGEAKARLGRAERDVNRLGPLVEAHAASRREHDDAVSDADEARAAVASAEARLAQARLDLSWTRVEAPIDGVTSRALRSEGSLVSANEGEPLLRLSQVEPIWVRFSVPDRVWLAIKKGVAAATLTEPAGGALEVTLATADGTDHPEHGRVNFSDPMIDPATGSVGLRAEVPNRGRSLLPGQFVRVRLLGIERPATLLVPQRAVQQGAAGKFVFVLGADDTAEARPVEAGDSIGTDWIIESGLKPGDRVVVDGAVKVQPGAKVQVVPETAGAVAGSEKPAGSEKDRPAASGTPAGSAKDKPTGSEAH